MRKININNFNEKLYYEKLNTGLEIFLVPLENKNNFFTMIGTKYGGDNINFKIDDKEVKSPAGVAHFLEHKLFEMKKELAPFAFYHKTGTNVNAETSNDYTIYYFSGNNEYYDNLKYLLNWITSFKTTAKKVEKEKGIILEEANMYKDSPDSVMFEKLRENVFIDHPRKFKVIGPDKDIKSITKKDVETCYNVFYRPSNMFLISVGSFNPGKTMKIIKNELKDFKNGAGEIKKALIDEPDHVRKDFDELFLDIETSKVALSFKINKNKFENLALDDYNLDYYLQILLNIGIGLTSDFREYLQNKKLFHSIGYQVSSIKTHQLIDLFATTDQPEKLIKELKKELPNLKILKKDFERIKKTWIASEIRMIDNVGITAYNILDDILDYKEFKNNKINDIKSLDFNILKKVQECIDWNNNSVVIVWPKMAKENSHKDK